MSTTTTFNTNIMGIQFDTLTLSIIAQLRNVDMIKVIELMGKSELFKYICNCTILSCKFLQEGPQSDGVLNLLEKFSEAMKFFTIFTNAIPSSCINCTPRDLGQDPDLCEVCLSRANSTNITVIDVIYKKIVDIIMNSVIVQKSPDCFQKVNAVITAIQNEDTSDEHLNALLISTQEQMLSLPILLCSTDDINLIQRYSNEVLELCVNAIHRYSETANLDESDVLRTQLLNILQ
jgi:hypothetical protein